MTFGRLGVGKGLCDIDSTFYSFQLLCRSASKLYFSYFYNIFLMDLYLPNTPKHLSKYETDSEEFLDNTAAQECKTDTSPHHQQSHVQFLEHLEAI